MNQQPRAQRVKLDPEICIQTEVEALRFESEGVCNSYALSGVLRALWEQLGPSISLFAPRTKSTSALLKLTTSCTKAR